jgi:ubiquinone/menaquinone biosynthesis C-methylase UbiE
MEAARANIAAYWETLSATYDDAPDHRLRGAAEHDAWLHLLGSLLPPPPARVLDLGTGTGFLALLLAELGHPVLGLDLAPGMVALAREKTATLPTPPGFVVGDAGAPPVAAGAFDVVISRHLLWTLPDPLSALRNWRRALRPNGQLVIIDGLWATGQSDDREEDTAPDEAYERFYTPAVRERLPLLGARTLDRVFALITEAGFGEPTAPSLAALAGANHHLHPGSFILAAARG